NADSEQRDDDATDVGAASGRELLEIRGRRPLPQELRAPGGHRRRPRTRSRMRSMKVSYLRSVNSPASRNTPLHCGHVSNQMWVCRSSAVLSIGTLQFGQLMSVTLSSALPIRGSPESSTASA